MEPNDTHYDLLTNSIRASLKKLKKLNTDYKRSNNISIFLDIAALASLVYGFITFSTNPYNLLLFIMISAFLSYLGTVMVKARKEKLKKATEALKTQLLFNVCDCENHCDCRQWLGKHLKEEHISL